MIQPTLEKSIAELDREIAEIEEAGGARDQLHAIKVQLSGPVSIAEQLKRTLAIKRCELAEMKARVDEAESKIDELRFDPTRLEVMASSSGLDTGAMLVLTNIDKSIAAIRWWISHADAKMTAKKAEIRKLELRHSELQAEIDKLEPERARLARLVKKFDAEKAPGRNQRDPDDLQLERMRFAAGRG